MGFVVPALTPPPPRGRGGPPGAGLAPHSPAGTAGPPLPTAPGHRRARPRRRGGTGTREPPVRARPLPAAAGKPRAGRVGHGHPKPVPAPAARWGAAPAGRGPPTSRGSGGGSGGRWAFAPSPRRGAGGRGGCSCAWEFTGGGFALRPQDKFSSIFRIRLDFQNSVGLIFLGFKRCKQPSVCDCRETSWGK